MRQTWWLRLVFAALVSLAVVDCGGDDGASGNGTDGTDGGNGDDTGGPNPLIEKIPGFWYLESIDGLSPDCWRAREFGEPCTDPDPPEEDANELVVDTTDLNCMEWWESDRGSLFTEREVRDLIAMNPPGDGCIRPASSVSDGMAIILDGNRVRTEIPPRDAGGFGSIAEGTVTGDGQRIDVTSTLTTTLDGTRSDRPPRHNVYRKVR